MLISSENTRREISTFAVFFIQSLVTNLSFFGIFLLLGFGHLPNLQQSLHHGAATHSRAHHGRMAEWLIVPPWKGGIRKFRIEGSNPSPSAKSQSDAVSCSIGFFIFFRIIKRSPPHFVSLSLSRSHSHWWVFWWASTMTLMFLVGTRYAKDRQATFRSPSSLSEE